MNNKALLDRLAAQVSIFEHHIKRLKKNPEYLHELDIELMGEKIKELYRLIHELQTGNSVEKEEPTVVNKAEKVHLVEVKPEPEIPAPKAPEMNSELGVGSSELGVGSSELGVGSSELGVQEEEAVEASVTETEDEPVDDAPPVQEVTNEQPEAPPAPEVVIEQPATNNKQPATSNEQPATSNEQPATSNEQPEAENVPKTTADLFSGPTTIADTFQAKDDNSIASKVNPSAVKDLKLAIGINDKFLFINELFKGDPSVYNQAIEDLNKAKGMNEASASIDSYRNEYSWADNSEAYHRLKKIVMSKYNG